MHGIADPLVAALWSLDERKEALAAKHIRSSHTSFLGGALNHQKSIHVLNRRGLLSGAMLFGFMCRDVNEVVNPTHVLRALLNVQVFGS